MGTDLEVHERAIDHLLRALYPKAAIHHSWRKAPEIARDDPEAAELIAAHAAYLAANE